MRVAWIAKMVQCTKLHLKVRQIKSQGFDAQNQ